MQQKKPKIVENAINEKPQSKTTKIEAISASGNLKVAVKGQTSGASANVQSVAVERNKAPQVKSATPLAAVPAQGGQASKAGAKPASDGAALPFPKQAKIQQSPKAVQHPGSPAKTAPEQKSNRPLMVVAAVGALVVGLGVVALQMGGGSDTEAQATGSTTAADAAPVKPVTSPVDITTVKPKAAEPVVAAAAPVAAETATPAVEEMSDSDKMIAKMTAGTLAALRGQGTADAAAPTAAQSAADEAAVSALYSMVVTAVSQGQSEGYIDQLVNDAYAKGEIAVPAGLIDGTGRVDTQSILSLFIAQ
ncbi:hypothetical protein TRM7557_01585 [Tritonibacter multivorans]|uniref:Uncharacterized protein n=1 Tax=Tritonibacter multivorans TaxID=928856 RepID=A0A0P1G7Z7_9RHOB|nr:hypothetical protein [Tritonibacter multivorans]MDA7422266.1 hypothetical protein [Tritonibacter multivorans]CUH77790.1 hypothetical protein TRM7557_01585 [Tritonibacter multivorans]SFD11626.1 hypothetical protein SAMN04488049_10762 [Tritonibacter multivorans]